MHEASVQMFEAYRLKYDGSVDRALAETIQAVALWGLSRMDFFAHAAFYGGTALRLLFNLDRFSKDLDFSLVKPLKEFRLSFYLGSLRNEMEAFGFTVEIEDHQKKLPTPIESAFIKANTRIHVIQAGVPRAIADRIHRNAVCRVKLEVDKPLQEALDSLIGDMDKETRATRKARAEKYVMDHSWLSACPCHIGTVFRN